MIHLGAILLYTLTAKNAEQINRRRTSGAAIQRQLSRNPPEWPAGAQAHIGADVAEGDVCPLMVTKIWPSGRVNGKVFLDGNDVLWVTDIAARTSDQQSGAWHAIRQES